MIDSTTLVAVAVLAAVAFMANAAEQRPTLRPILAFMLGVVNVGFVAALLLQPTPNPNVVIVAILFAGAAFAVMLAPVRYQLARVLPKPSTEGVGFNPDSPIQMAALVLCLYLVANTLLTYLAAGGPSGISEAVRNQESEMIEPSSLLIQMSIFVMFGFLGAGFGQRRNLPSALGRLGLRAPTPREVAVGVSMAIGLLFINFVGISTWIAVTPPEVVEQQIQVTQVFSRSLDTLFVGFLVAFTAAVGEEIAFRGALQPAFGILLTSVVFAVAHVQYTLTPLSLIIFALSIGLGYLRKQYNTTAAIVAHFLYNYGLVALSLYAQWAVTQFPLAR